MMRNQRYITFFFEQNKKLAVFLYKTFAEKLNLVAICFVFSSFFFWNDFHVCSRAKKQEWARDETKNLLQKKNSTDNNKSS